MKEHEREQRLLAAVGIARELGSLALRFHESRDTLAVSMKGPQNWLTEADSAVERLFKRRIAEAFPGDGVLGEETGGTPSERLWIINPIDGTANFFRGLPQWCVSIGFLLEGRAELGVIHTPVGGDMHVARRGRGATLNGKRIRAAGTADMTTAAVELGWSNRCPLSPYLAMVENCYQAGAHVLRRGSGALGLAHVADGRIDAYAELHINSWDVAAGILIAAEAGAVVNDYFTGDAILEGNPVTAAAPGIAAAFAAATGIADQ